MGVFKDTKEAFLRGASGNDIYEIAGAKLVCSHCGRDRFSHDLYLLNTSGMSLMNLDWANENADVYICKHCGHLEWFARL